jgi:hypothetical protein
MRLYRDGRQIFESPQEVHIREEDYESNYIVRAGKIIKYSL